MVPSPEEKSELAWLYARKQALLHIFGQQLATRLLPLDLQATQLFALGLFHQAIMAGKYTHGTFVEDEIDAVMALYSWEQQVPYGKGFAPQFASTVAGLALPAVAKHLNQLCTWYQEEHPELFEAENGGYRYLHDVLVQARAERVVQDTPSLARALEWLTAQAALAHPATSPAVALALPREPATAADPSGWESVLTHDHTRAEAEDLLAALDLLEATSAGTWVASPEAKPAAWVGAVLALQRHVYLSRNKEAVARVLRKTYGNVFGARTLQTGLNAENEVQNAYYNRACAYLAARAAEQRNSGN